MPQFISNNKIDTSGLYYIGLILYILLSLSFETRWNYPDIIQKLMRVFALILLSVNFVLVLKKYKKPNEILFVVLFLITSLIVGNNGSFTEDGNLLYINLFTFLLVCGAKGINYRNIIKVYLIVGGVYCLLTIFASSIGIIENISVYTVNHGEVLGSSDNENRYCFGYGWPTNMANHVFFIILCYFSFIGRLLNKKELLAATLIAFFLWHYTGSRLSSFCIFLLVLFSLFQNFKKFKAFIYSKGVVCCYVVSIPFFVFVSYFFASKYDSSNMFWLSANFILSGRLSLGYDALSYVGIPLLGQKYIMYGSFSDDGMAYNYIDCSYLQLLIIYGVLYTLIIALSYVYICKKHCRFMRNNIVASVFFAGISGLISQHFIEIYMNPFLILLFANKKLVLHENQIYTERRND